MSTTRNSRVILAAAGSRKTEHIIEEALAVRSGRVLILTFTAENQRHIIKRLESKVGAIPPHLSVMGWFSFLISECAKPYQLALTERPFHIRGLNFQGRRNRYTKKESLEYFLDCNQDLYRDGVADFVVSLNKKTDDSVIRRLERVYSHIFIDEVQDLVGYALDVLDLLLKSEIELVAVGDPRQHTYATNLGSRNKKYRGAGLADWFEERSGFCLLEERCVSYRSNQLICDFADSLYPEFPTTTSVDVSATGHDGVFTISRDDAASYFREHHPVTVLRYDKNADTAGLPAMNIGLAKGRTFDRVLLFPTRTMLRFLDDGHDLKPGSRAKLYVAATRARFSVALVGRAPRADLH